MTWTRINPEDPTTYPETYDTVAFEGRWLDASVRCVGYWNGSTWVVLQGGIFEGAEVPRWAPLPELPSEEAEPNPEHPAELVERVAKAIYESDGDDLLPWSELFEGKPGEGVGRELYRHLARAAIEAIRSSPAELPETKPTAWQRLGEWLADRERGQDRTWEHTTRGEQHFLKLWQVLDLVVQGEGPTLDEALEKALEKLP